MKNKVAIVVCGIKNHIELINRLKKRGYYTILVDAAEYPIARAAADEFVQIDIFDFEGIKLLAKERNADIIINACQEHLNAGICRICEELGLPHPYSYETGMAISNKIQMKKRMKENNIPTTSFVCVQSPSEVEDIKLKYPLYIKSSVGSGSNAVNRALNESEAKDAVEKALKKYPNAEVIIEEEALGYEYNVYCFPENGKANVLLVARRYTDNLSEDHVTKLVGTLAQPLISSAAMEEIERTAQRITEVYELENVPMFMQIMVNGNSVNVIEFAGRMAGGFGYQTILESLGIDWFEATINAFLRIPNNLSYENYKGVITVSHVYGFPCTFGEIVGLEELLEKGIVSSVSLPKERGMKVQEGFANGSLIAYLIHKADNIDTLLNKLEDTFNSIEMFDINGNPKMNKTLILNRERIFDHIPNSNSNSKMI